eukprot:Pgem_evm1s6054
MVVTGLSIQSIFDSYYTGTTEIKLMVWLSIVAVFQLILALFPNVESFRGMSAFGSVLGVIYSLIAISLSFEHYSSNGNTGLSYDLEGQGKNRCILYCK